MKAEYYPKEMHGIDPHAIDPKALYILDRLRASHYTAYLVGGSVRDLLLGKKPKDFDIATEAKPEEIKALFPNAILIGKRFRLAHVRFGKKVIEVATFRAGDIEKEELITEDNMWGTPEEDVYRRDFTINGLLYDSEKEEIIDCVGGYIDIQKRLLRVIGQPFLRFKQDPVRMIRCLKFEARFGLEVEESARLALVESTAEITKSAPARVLEEILRMLESGAAEKFFRLITDHGLMEQIFPLISRFLEKQEGGEIYQLLGEADRTLKHPHTPELSRPVLLACLLFPLLKRHLQVHFIERNRQPNLGDIQQESAFLLHQAFDVTFTVPRCLRAQTLQVLIAQYRITPFQKKKWGKIHIPRIPEFKWALDFFKLRTCLEPGLQEIYAMWEEAYQKVIDQIPERTLRRRRFRKREARK